MLKIKSRLKTGESELIFWLNRNKSLFLLGILFVFGVMLGSFTACGSHNKAIFEASFIESFLEARQTQSIEKNFFSALTPNIIAWAMTFLCGFCAVSAPIIPLILLIRAAGYGVLSGCLLLYRKEFSTLFMQLILLPNTVISAITLIFCCREAMTMSRLCWENMTAATRSDGGYMTIFCGKMLLYAILLVAGAAIECYCQSLFL